MKVGLAIVERKDMQYLYPDGDGFVFMDLQTYEQVHVPADDRWATRRDYLTEGGTGPGRDARRGPDRGRPACVDGAGDHEDATRA